jgi:Mitochondrial carrier protein
MQYIHLISGADCSASVLTHGFAAVHVVSSVCFEPISADSAIQYSAFEFYNRHLSQLLFGPDSKSPVKRFIAGALAGTTSVLCTYPIDLARTMLAVQIKPAPGFDVALDAAASNAARKRGMLATLVYVARTEGFRGLYRGSYPTLVGVVPYSGISFLSFGVLKHVADEIHFSDHRPITTSLICGGSAGLREYPFSSFCISLSCRLRSLTNWPAYVMELSQQLLNAPRTP